MAARLFPEEARGQVAAVYAFCRFTDDLVDEAPADLAATVVTRRLQAWTSLAREAFEGSATGIPFLDRAMTDACRANVLWLYAGSLLRGAAMDVRPRPYASCNELRRYTFRVAGSVGAG